MILNNVDSLYPKPLSMFSVPLAQPGQWLRQCIRNVQTRVYDHQSFCVHLPKQISPLSPQNLMQLFFGDFQGGLTWALNRPLRFISSKLSPYTCQNGCFTKNNTKQVLVRMWKKGNPLALFIGGNVTWCPCY